MEKKAKILVAGGSGLVGSSIIRNLLENGYKNIIAPRSSEFNLENKTDTQHLFEKIRPNYVFLCAAKVGGIFANLADPVAFILNNLKIQNNVIESSYLFDVNKLLFLGSSCIYPKNSRQPIKEEYLLSDYLEESNKPYAIAKIAGITLCQAYHKQYDKRFICLMPSNVYGPNDNFNLKTSHFLAALIRKLHVAKTNNQSSVMMCGTGNPRRELLYVDDLATACLTVMHKYESSEPINVGYGTDLSIKEIANLTARIVGYKGDIVWDQTQPDGTREKLLDITKICSLGWQPTTPLELGIRKTYQWWLKHRTK